MALLQISEPGQSPDPHRHRIAVGIDLGTTNSLVAAVRNGIAVVLNDRDGHALLPSIVRYLRDGRTVVGREAEAEQARDPRNTIASVKRFMGRGLKDVTHAEILLPSHVAGENMLAQNERARPIAQVCPDRVGGEMKEGGKQAGRYSRPSRRFELARKALTLFVMIVPSVIEQLFQRARFIIYDHSEFLRQVLESKVQGY